MNTVNYEKISKEIGWTKEEIKRGYSVFSTSYGVEVIQRIDDLDMYGLDKFETDTVAGEQALKDGYKLFTSDHKDLLGWYIIDTPKNRNEVNKYFTY